MKTKSYGLQNETRQYLRRLYAYGRELQGADIADLDDFVKGLKQLGLWGNTVCWPMRAQHNMGTGSNLLSLGGGGTYDGTLFGSVTWSQNGLDVALINSPSSYVVVNKLEDRNEDYSLFSIAMVRSNYMENICTRGTGNPTYGFNLSHKWSATQSALIVWGSPAGLERRITNVDYNVFQSLHGNVFRYPVVKKVDVGFNGGSWSNNTSTIQTGKSNTKYTFFKQYPAESNPQVNGTIAFNMMVNKTLNTQDFTNLHNLTKTTIAKGLGLP